MPYEVDHHAIVVGIARYPGLTTLGGPEHDADAFREWLVDPAGGNVDPAKVTLITSSAFPPLADPEDPYDANPTDTQFRRALNGLCRAPDKSWLPRVGKRLWLFLAGHGFTAGPSSDPSLLTAQAQSGDTAHIAAKRYVDRIANAGFFDEIVLVMDACQDVMRSASVNDPTWTPPDKSATPAYFGALAAPRGSKAREAAYPASGDPVRGFFTRTIVEALRNAPADAAGWVTAEAVRQEAFNRWNAAGMPAATGVARPQIDAPAGMNIYRRAVPPPTREGATAAPAGEGAAGGAAKLNVTFDLPIDASLVRIFDQADQQIFHGAPAALGGLVAGHYTAQVRVGDALGSAGFQLGSGEGLRLPVRIDQPRFSSPIPLPTTRTTHEWQSEPVAELQSQLRRMRQAPRRHPGALLVFARDWMHQPAAPWPDLATASAAIRLRRVDAEPRMEAPTQVASDPFAGYVAMLFPGLAPGAYALGFRRTVGGRPLWQELVVTVVGSLHRTEVFVASIDDDGASGRRFDPDGAAVLILPDGLDEVDEVATRTEAARLAHLDGRAYEPGGLDLRWLVDTSPVAGLHIAYAHTLTREPDRKTMATLVDRLGRGALHGTPDVETLRRWLGDARTSSSSPIGEPPMFARGWDLQRQIDVRAGRPGATPGPAAQRQVGRWRVASPIWTITAVPEGRSPDARATEVPRVPGQVGPGRIAVDPQASALEQSVRRATLDRLADEELPDRVDLGEVASATARAWNLRSDLVEEAVATMLATGVDPAGRPQDGDRTVVADERDDRGAAIEGPAGT